VMMRMLLAYRPSASYELSERCVGCRTRSPDPTEYNNFISSKTQHNKETLYNQGIKERRRKGKKVEDGGTSRYIYIYIYIYIQTGSETRETVDRYPFRDAGSDRVVSYCRIESKSMPFPSKWYKLERHGERVQTQERRDRQEDV
jgi:hypothetical protein